MNRERFASKMLILMQECAELYSINPIIVAAQACLETGYGKSILSKKANNLFGIKAGKEWKGLKYPMKKREFSNMCGWVVMQVPYRSYSTWKDCVIDYSALLKKNSIIEQPDDPIKFLDGILPKANPICEYITDPRYREKILFIAKKWKWL